jgi:lysophospholipase L1-like esterase
MALGLSALVPHSDGLPASAADQARFVSAADPSFRYEGRFDFSDPASPVAIWQASRISVDFDGDRVAVRFDGATGQVFFDARVDGASFILDLRTQAPGGALELPVSGSGIHHLVLFKRSEAAAGTAHFAGIEIARGAKVFPPAPSDYRMKMEFIGDSITVGACDEDGPRDQWEDRSTHDAALSWAALTAAAFSARYQNISVSGIGVATGYVDVLAGQVWDRIYPAVSSPKADLGKWVPDVVFVLLGQNDDSYPRAHGLPFPAGFGKNYICLVRAIRAAYPKSSIVLLNGGMWDGIHSPALGAAWAAAVADLESKDPRIHHYVFAHWTWNHPRVADHRMLAGELIAWLRSQPFMISKAAD